MAEHLALRTRQILICATRMFFAQVGWSPENYVKRCNYPSVDCEVSDWGEWGLCSQSCGGGFIIIHYHHHHHIITIIIITVTIISIVSQV